MYVVLLGSNLVKAKEPISLMQNLDQNTCLGTISTSEVVGKNSFLMACEDIRRWDVAERVQLLSGPWPYHTTAYIPNQVVQFRESQSER